LTREERSLDITEPSEAEAVPDSGSVPSVTELEVCPPAPPLMRFLRPEPEEGEEGEVESVGEGRSPWKEARLSLISSLSSL
jgi:hypothetical protein